MAIVWCCTYAKAYPTENTARAATVALAALFAHKLDDCDQDDAGSSAYIKRTNQLEEAVLQAAVPFTMNQHEGVSNVG